MSGELETRLAEALGALPGPSAVAGARARAAALDALPAPHRATWGRAAVLALAAVGVLAAGAAALAAIGTIHVGVGRAPRGAAERLPARLVLPPGARGIAVVVGGRLWLTTRGGTRIEGLPVTAAELSPHALYVAAGIGRSLVVMAPDGRRAWSVPVRGRVEAIAWAPSGLRLAYAVRTARGFELRTVEGDGDHDRLLDAAVRPVTPSWRADSLALAYVAPGGHAVVYDLAHGTHRLVGGGRCAVSVDALAYAPQGSRLALAGPHGVGVAGAGGGARCLGTGSLGVAGIAWSGRELVYAVNPARAAAGARPGLRMLTIGADGALRGSGRIVTAGPVRALAGAGGGRLAVVSSPSPGQTELVVAEFSRVARTVPVRGLLLRLPGAAAVEAVVVR
jgi:hypothetical protein